MSNLIDRQAAIDAIEEDNRNGHYSCFASNEDAQRFKQTIMELPPVEQKRWIPVSERLPEEDGEYLVTVKSTFKNTRNYIKLCCFARNLYLIDEYDFVDKKGIAGFYKYDSEYGYYEMTDVIAWMPLPEPYKMCGGEE